MSKIIGEKSYVIVRQRIYQSPGSRQNSSELLFLEQFPQWKCHFRLILELKIQRGDRYLAKAGFFKKFFFSLDNEYQPVPFGLSLTPRVIVLYVQAAGHWHPICFEIFQLTRAGGPIFYSCAKSSNGSGFQHKSRKMLSGDSTVYRIHETRGPCLLEFMASVFSVINLGLMMGDFQRQVTTLRL